MKISIITARSLGNNSRINTSTLKRRMQIMHHRQIRNPKTTITTSQRPTRNLSATNRRRKIPTNTSLLHNRISNLRPKNTRPVSLNANRNIKRTHNSNDNLNSINTLIARKNGTARSSIISNNQVRIQISNLRLVSRPNSRISQLSQIRKTVNLTTSTQNTSHLMSMHLTRISSSPETAIIRRPSVTGTAH